MPTPFQEIRPLYGLIRGQWWSISTKALAFRIDIAHHRWPFGTLAAAHGSTTHGAGSTGRQSAGRHGTLRHRKAHRFHWGWKNGGGPLGWRAPSGSTLPVLQVLLKKIGTQLIPPTFPMTSGCRLVILQILGERRTFVYETHLHQQRFQWNFIGCLMFP